MAKYETIPVNKETKERVLTMCKALGMGSRSQGAFIGKLVDDEYKKMAAANLLPIPTTEKSEPNVQA